MNTSIRWSSDATEILDDVEQIDNAIKGMTKTLEKLKRTQENLKGTNMFSDASKQVQKTEARLKAMKSLQAKLLGRIAGEAEAGFEKTTKSAKARLQKLSQYAADIKINFGKNFKLDGRAKARLETELTKLMSTLYKTPGQGHTTKTWNYLKNLMDGKDATLDQNLAASLPQLRNIADIVLKAKDTEEKALAIQRAKSKEIAHQIRLREKAAKYTDSTLLGGINPKASLAERAKYGQAINPLQKMIESGNLTTAAADRYHNDFLTGNIPTTAKGRQVVQMIAAIYEAQNKLGLSAARAAEKQELLNAAINKSRRIGRLDKAATLKTKQFEDIMMSQVGNNTFVSPEEQAGFRKSLRPLQNMLGSGKISTKQFQNYWDEYRKGSFEATTKVERRLEVMFDRIRAKMEKFGSFQKKLADEAQKDIDKVTAEGAHRAQRDLGKKFINEEIARRTPDINKMKTVDGQGGHKYLISDREKAAYLKATTQLENFVAKGKISYARAKELANDYAKGVISANNQVERDYIGTLKNVDAAFKRFGNENKADLAKIRAENARTANAISSKYESSMKRTVTAVLSAGTLMRLFLIQNFHLILGRTTSAVFDMVRSLKELELRVAQIRTISDEAQLSTDRWRDGIIDLANALGMDELDVAAGVYESISNQVAKGEEAFRFVGEAALFARTTVATTADAVSLLSSAINSFGYKSQQTEEIAAQLFSTIDVGRFTTEELAGVYGRIAPVANQLGVSMGELNGMLAMLSNKGVKVSEVSTQISGIMQKLLKPTKEMKNLLAEQGYTSGYAMVQTLGLVGTLKLLQEVAAKSGDRMADLVQLFDEVRGFRGISIFDEKGIQQLETTTQLINDSINRYQKAQQEVMNSLTVKLDQKIGTLKTYAYTSVIKPLLEDFNKLLDSADGLVNIFKRIQGAFSGIDIKGILESTNLLTASLKTVQGILSTPIMQGVLLYSGIRLATAYIRDMIKEKQALSMIEKTLGGLNAAEAENEKRTRLMSMGFSGAITAGERLKMTLTSIGVSLGFMAANLALVAVTTWITNALAKAEQLKMEAEQALEDLKGIGEELAAHSKDINQQITADDQKTQKTLLQQAEESVAERTRALNGLVNASRLVLNQLTQINEESLKKQEKGYKKYLDSVVRAYNNAAKEAEKAFEKTTNAIEKLKDELEDMRLSEFFRQYKSANEQSQKGGKELTYKSANVNIKTLTGNVFKELNALVDKKTGLITDSEKATKLIDSLVSEYENLKSTTEKSKEKLEVDARINKLLETRRKILSDIVKYETGRAPQVKAQQEAQEDRAKDLQEKIDEAKGFKIEGDSVEEASKQLKEFEAIANDIMSMIRDQPAKLQQETYNVLLQRYKGLKDQITNIGKAADLGKIGQDIEKRSKEQEDRLKQRDAAMKDLANKRKAVSDLSEKGFNDVITALRPIKLPGTTSSENIYDPAIRQQAERLGLAKQGGFGGNTDMSDRLDALITSVVDRVNKQITPTTTQEQRAEIYQKELSALTDLLDFLGKAQEDYKFKREKVGDTKGSVLVLTPGRQWDTNKDPNRSGKFTGKTLEPGEIDNRKPLLDSVAEIERAMKDAQTVQARINEIETKYKQAIEDQKTDRDRIIQLQKQIGDKEASGRERLIGKFDELIETLNKVIANSPKGFANGGIIGGKAGYDSITAKVSRGEYVVNAQAAAANRPLLDAMNYGKTVVSRPSFNGNQPNNVSISVGDINIEVATTDNQQITPELAKNIGRALSREIRRGNVVL